MQSELRITINMDDLEPTGLNWISTHYSSTHRMTVYDRTILDAVDELDRRPWRTWYSYTNSRDARARRSNSLAVDS
jgi:hypothetical protein